MNIKPELRVDEETGKIKVFVKSAGVVSENGDDDYKYFESFPEEQGENYIEKQIQEADDCDSAFIENIESNIYSGKEEKKGKKKGKKKAPDHYRPVYMSGNAITLSDKVQIVIRFYGPPEEILSNYDDVHCTNYWTSSDGKLYLNKDALASIVTKDLIYVGSKYPLCSIIRLRKFIQRGWKVNAGQIVKQCMQLNDLDLCDASVLEEQLTGVDTAYFSHLIGYCKREIEKDKNFKISVHYVVSLIDKLF